MVEFMKVNGLIIQNMAKDLNCIPIQVDMKANLLMVNLKVLVPIYGLMVKFMMEIGLVE